MFYHALLAAIWYFLRLFGIFLIWDKLRKKGKYEKSRTTGPWCVMNDKADFSIHATNVVKDSRQKNSQVRMPKGCSEIRKFKGYNFFSSEIFLHYEGWTTGKK